MTPEETDGVIAYLNEAWPQRPISSITAGIWGSALAEFPHIRVVAVLQQLTRTEKYRPALAVILAELQPPAVGETASEAFAKVWSEIGRCGLHGHPKLSDRAARAVKHVGGWPTICAVWQRDKIHFHRKEFTKEFDELEHVEARREKHQRAMGDGVGVDGNKALDEAMGRIAEGVKR